MAQDKDMVTGFIIFTVLFCVIIGIFLVYYLTQKPYDARAARAKHEENLRNFYETEVIPAQRRRTSSHQNIERTFVYNTDSNSSCDETV